MRTPEEQYLHELIESYVAPLRSEIRELRQQLSTELVKNNGVLPVVIDCSTCKHREVSKYVEPCYGCRDNDGYDNHESAIGL